jgi:two-component system sensor histidine kinase KdpD
LVLVALSALIAGAVDQVTTGANLAMILLLSVLGSGLAFGLWPALTAAGLAAFALNFFFLEPGFSLAIGHPTDVLTFVVFFAVAMASGWLTGRVRDQSVRTEARASIIAALLAASRRLSASPTRQSTVEALVEQISAAANARVIVLAPEGATVEGAAGWSSLDPLDAATQAAARWAWDKGEAAGHGTDTLPGVPWTFRPLQGLRDRVGVVGVGAAAEPEAMDPDGEKLVQALIDQGAVALERADLVQVAVEADAIRRSDRFRAALLSSISHDLRTPLASILGSTTTMIEYGEGMAAATRSDLLECTRQETERLSRYVGDLLHITRLEAEGVKLRHDWVDVRDVLGAAADRVARRLGRRCLRRDFPATLDPMQLDSNLLEQAVVNILENAIAYSPDDTRIDLAIVENHAGLAISVADEGKGIPPDELERVFEKFRRIEVPGDATQGLGLGLSISKGFVEAIGGRIEATSPLHADRGTRFTIILPRPGARDLGPISA